MTLGVALELILRETRLLRSPKWEGEREVLPMVCAWGTLDMPHLVRSG
jgi:hypothetical protein